MPAQEKARATAGETLSKGNAENRLQRVSPQEVRARVEAAIERELERCERCMTPEQWAGHREWVLDYLIASAREWLRNTSAKGRL